MTQLKKKPDERVSILLVDDEPRNLLTLEQVLAPLGESLVMASSGKEALKHVLKQRFALILLDVNMPGINGYEVAELVRQRAETRETPIIFITAYDKDDLGIFRGYDMGAVDYLVKPIQPKILVSKARFFVDLHRKTLELARQKEIAVAELQKNKELNQTNQLLERMKQEAEQFASIASHDLQTPLRHIASYVDLLKKSLGNEIPDEQKEALEIIAAGTRRMKALIGDLLSLSRIGPQSMELRAVSMQSLIEDVVRTMSSSVESADAEVVIEPLPVMLVDEVKMRQVFQNLIANALKYRHQERRTKIHVGAKELGRNIQIEIRDNGIGIPQEHFARIFEIFQRLHRQDEYSGTGIGLAICKKIMAMHEGEIWLDSTVGEGSTFYLKLPRGLKNGVVL